jgi:cytochrome c oxidase subunit 1
MVFMGNAMHRIGLAGEPRRTAEPFYDGVTFDTALGSISELHFQIALGSVILTVSLLLFMAHLFLSWFDVASNPAPDNGVIPEALSGPENAPIVLENLRLWTAIALVLILLTYALPLASIVSANGFFGSAGTLVGTAYEFAVSPFVGVVA